MYSRNSAIYLQKKSIIEIERKSGNKRQSYHPTITNRNYDTTLPLNSSGEKKLPRWTRVSTHFATRQNTEHTYNYLSKTIHRPILYEPLFHHSHFYEPNPSNILPPSLSFLIFLRSKSYQHKNKFIIYHSSSIPHAFCFSCLYIILPHLADIVERKIHLANFNHSISGNITKLISSD